MEEAEIKGHYLILIWTEFTNLHAPTGKSSARSSTAFSAGLFAGTANVEPDQPDGDRQALDALAGPRAAAEGAAVTGITRCVLARWLLTGRITRRARWPAIAGWPAPGPRAGLRRVADLLQAEPVRRNHAARPDPGPPAAST